jgi:hypothetical protein
MMLDYEGAAEGSSTLDSEQSYKWVGYYILTQNLKVLLDLWVSYL